LKVEGLTKIRKTLVLLAQCNFDLLIKCYGEVEVHFTQEKIAAKLLQYASSSSLCCSFLDEKSTSSKLDSMRNI